MSTALKQKIYEVIKTPHLANFATLTEDNKPWTRYVMALGSDDLTIRFSTFLGSRKLQHLKANSEVHLTSGANSVMDMGPYVQVQGTAFVSTNQQDRHAFWNPALAEHFDGPDDPRYAVVIITPYRIEYNSPQNTGAPDVWEK